MAVAPDKKSIITPSPCSSTALIYEALRTKDVSFERNI